VVGQNAIGLQPADAHRLLAERDRLREDVQANEGEDLNTPGAAVLVAERDPFAAGFLDYFLRSEGYDVRIVFEAGDVMRNLDDHRADVVVVDLLISGGLGLQLCRTVRARSAVPILAISVLDSRAAALDAGVDAFLRKPLDRRQLVAKVRDLLRTSAYL